MFDAECFVNKQIVRYLLKSNSHGFKGDGITLEMIDFL